MTYSILEFLYTLVCYLGIALCITDLIFIKRSHNTTDHLLSFSLVGILWMLCLYLPSNYGIFLMVFNTIVLASYIPIDTVYRYIDNKMVRRNNYG